MHRPSLATRLRLPSHDPGDAQAGADSSRPGAGALERCRQFVEQSAQSAEQSADRLMRASAPRVRDAKASAERLGRDAKAAAQRLARDAMAAAQRLARDAEQRARQLAAVVTRALTPVPVEPVPAAMLLPPLPVGPQVGPGAPPIAPAAAAIEPVGPPVNPVMAPARSTIPQVELALRRAEPSVAHGKPAVPAAAATFAASAPAIPRDGPTRWFDPGAVSGPAPGTHAARRPVSLSRRLEAVSRRDFDRRGTALELQSGAALLAAVLFVLAIDAGAVLLAGRF